MNNCTVYMDISQLPKMPVILFQDEYVEKIKLGEKTMTARHWRKNPPKVGQLIRAQTGRPKDTTFAILKVLDVQVWNGIDVNEKIFSGKYTGHQIARKEGFEDIGEFKGVYGSLNAHNWWDIQRKHYFIEFKVHLVI